MYLIAIPTWGCGLSCHYCGYLQLEKTIKYKGSGVELRKDITISAQKWLEIFDKYKADVIEFTGGEPLKYQEFPEIIKNVKTKWAITSNTLNAKLKDLDLSNCARWTASFHLHVNEKGRINFLGNIAYIASLKIPTSVTLVATIDNIHDTLRWANRINNAGFQVNIHPYYDDPEFSWYDHSAELEFLKRSKYVVYGDGLLEYKGIGGSKKCSAGRDYAVVSPEGAVYKCLTDLLYGRSDIKELSKKDIECSEKCIFPCDWSRILK